MAAPRPKLLPDEYEAQLSNLREELEAANARASKAERERELAEGRGRIWFEHAARLAHAVDGLIEHIDAEMAADRVHSQAAIYRYLRVRLVKAMGVTA